MLNKTKAALQSRSCQLTTSNLCFQDSTVIVPVNTDEIFIAPINTHNLGNALISWQSAKLRIGYAALQYSPKAQTAPLAQLNLNRLNSEEADFIQLLASCLDIADLKPRDIARVISFGLRLDGLISRCRCRKLRIILSEMKPPERPALSSFSAGGASSSNGQRFKSHSFESTARCFLWRRLISFLAAAIKKPAVLSSGSLTPSINSRSTSGSLTETCSDLLFLLPVAIAESPYARWCSVCLRKILNQALTWCSPVNILVVFTSLGGMDKNNEARLCANTNRASYHNVIEAYIMAAQQHTQTRSKFTWRFLAVGESTPEMRPVVLYTNATTEKEARDNCPGWVLYFAARFPLHVPEIQGVRHA